MRKHQATTTICPECQVTIVDEVHNTHQVLRLPETAEEALENCLPLVAAREWLRWFGESTTEPIQVSIHQDETEIICRWHATGDPEAARERMNWVLSKTWLEDLFK